MNEDIESQISSDDNIAASSESQPQSAQVEAQATPAPQQEKELPFHEHPRFKEVIDQKNQYAKQVEALMQRLERLESAPKATQKAQEDALIARLKGIDPEFGGRFESINEKLQKLESLEQWKTQFEATQFQKEAVGKFEDLAAKNNISSELVPVYRAMLDQAYQQGKIKSAGDVGTQFKEVQSTINKWAESMKRETTANYVKDKKATASKNPTLAKGGTVKPGSEEYSKDPAVARQQAVRKIVEMAKASKDV